MSDRTQINILLAVLLLIPVSLAFALGAVEAPQDTRAREDLPQRVKLLEQKVESLEIDMTWLLKLERQRSR